MERVRLAIPDQLPPKGLWSKPETRGCSGQDHAVQTLGQEGQGGPVTTGTTAGHEFIGFWPHAPA